MQVKEISPISKLMCYSCGSEDIQSICHHDGCQLPICQQCGSASVPTNSLPIRRKNTEFTDLDVADLVATEIASHCDEHVHYKESREVIFLYLFIIWLGPLFAFFVHSPQSNSYDNVWLRSVVGFLAVFNALFLFVLFVDKRLAYDLPMSPPPPLPVIGQNHEAKVVESVYGTAILTLRGRYLVYSERPRGKFQYSLQFVLRDRTRLDKYREKYKVAPTAFDAGFALLHGAENLEFTNHQVNNVLRLRGLLADHHFFQGGSNRRWLQELNYSFTPGEGVGSSLPIQIFPTLVSEGRHAWGITLTVQTPAQFDNDLIEHPEVKKLVLKVPSQWGDVDSSNPFASYSKHEVTWANVKLQPIQNEQHDKYRTTFYVRFSESVNHEPQETISGHVQVNFSGALSGLSHISLFNALGYKENIDPVSKKQTEVTIHYRFDLRGLRLRRLVSVPCHHVAPGLIPNSKTIVKLVNALAENNVYVKHVLENLPQMNKADAQVMNRLWVISGRRYDGVFPIDFRIVVSGQACYGDSDTAVTGKTNFEITTQAIVTSENMINSVDKLNRELMRTIKYVADSAQDDNDYFYGKRNR